jgi:O-antigen/teichoic acid export membrane protein
MAPELSDWHDYFVTTATVAGTLVGLLFVALSIHLRVLSDERHADLRQDARAILLWFVVAMTLALLPLIPQSLVALGQELLVVFVLIVVMTVRSVPMLFRSSEMYDRGNRLIRGALLIAGWATTLAGGLAFIAGQVWPVQMLAASIFVLIVMAVFRTWDIVFRGAQVSPPD